MGPEIFPVFPIAPKTMAAREQGDTIAPLTTELQSQLDRLSDGKAERVRDVQSRKVSQ